MERQLAGRPFRVRALSERVVQIPGVQDWRSAARLGYGADGWRAQETTNLGVIPPAARESSARGVMESVRAKGQVGYPPTISAVAKLGYSVMAYQSPDNLFDSCDGDGSM